jgi:integration host factor subunit beta
MRAAMLKPELIKLISDRNPHLYQRDVENIVNAILGEIVGAMARGDRVELRDFGTFSVRQWRSRIARNPRTGTAVAVKKKAHPHFKAGKEMRARLNRSSV